MKTFEIFQSNFNLGDYPVKKLAIDTQRIAAVTWLTGQSVFIIEKNKTKCDRRTKLQTALAELSKWRAAEEDVDGVLKTAIDKNMRV